MFSFGFIKSRILSKNSIVVMLDEIVRIQDQYTKVINDISEKWNDDGNGEGNECKKGSKTQLLKQKKSHAH